MAAVRGVGTWGRERRPQDENGLIALRRPTLETRAYLPIRDPNYAYTDADRMGTRAWLDDDTVLADVYLGGFDDGVRHLFTWDVETGELRRVSELPAGLELGVAASPAPGS